MSETNIENLPEKTRSLVVTILKNRVEIVRMACQQRAKFEGWLKFELASVLVSTSGFSNVILEDSYQSNGRSDISVIYEREKWFIEMKTANTNWRADGLENLTRPITRNMDGIIEDIEILKLKSPPAHGLVVFTIFPIPERLVTQYPAQLNYHLERIEDDAILERGILRSVMQYLPVSIYFGIGVFVIQCV